MFFPSHSVKDDAVGCKDFSRFIVLENGIRYDDMMISQSFNVNRRVHRMHIFV